MGLFVLVDSYVVGITKIKVFLVGLCLFQLMGLLVSVGWSPEEYFRASFWDLYFFMIYVNNIRRITEEE